MRNRPNSILGLWLVVAGAAATVAACSGPDAALRPPPHTDSGVFWSLALDHRAVTMSTVAPYDTIRLTATPRDAAGNAISGLPRATFMSSDLKTLQVDSNGVVRALATGSGIMVIATLSASGYTLGDTAIINVTDTSTAPVLASLSIHPDSGDSAETSVDFPRTVSTRALSASGDSIGGLSIYYATSDDHTAVIDRSQGIVQGIYPGRVRITAIATAYGVTRADTVVYVIGYPVFSGIQIIPQTVGGKTTVGFWPSHLTLGNGATVAFENLSHTMVDITFDDSTHVDSSAVFCPFWRLFAPWVCGAGNIPPFATDTTVPLSGFRQRAFPVPETYNFHSTLFGTSGQIVIVDWHSFLR